MDNNISHVVKISERNSITISGVTKIVNFDDKEFNLDSVLGGIIIRGCDLEMIKLDTVDGNVSIKGNIDSFIYTNNIKNKDSLFSKLFK